MFTPLRTTYPRDPARVRRRASERPEVPHDAARYVCECGKAFTGSVTTSVKCPACGQQQPW